MPIRPGIYEHFSGHRYKVLGVGHAVTGDGTDEVVGEWMVVYHALFVSPDHGRNALWTRPVANFTEEVTVDGVPMPRFRYVAPV